MSLTSTTLSSAMTATDTQMFVASASGFAIGNFVKVDQELFVITGGYVSSSLTVPVRRAISGTTTQAHPASAVVSVGTGADFANAAPQTTPSYPLAGRARIVSSYTGAGAITLPTPGNDAVAILNTTVAVAMTLADPSKDMDGDIIYIIAGGAAAFTVQAAGGFGGGGGSYDVLTFAAGAQVAIWAIAANGKWCIPNSPAIAGTATDLLATIS